MCTDANGVSLPKSGAVFVFKRQSDSLWVLDDRLEGSDAGILDYFGSATAIHGESIVVGASNKNGADAEGNPVGQVGAAYVFVRKNGVWVEKAKFSTTVDAKAHLQFGKEVAIHDNTLVVSAARQGENAAGKVYVYTRGLDGSWTVEAGITEPESDGNRFRTFGMVLAYDGDFLAVSSTGLAFRGVVWIFQRTTTTEGVATWSQTQKLEASDGQELDYFGSALAFTGNILIVGMDNDDVDGKSGSGSVYIFKHIEDEGWLEIAKLTQSDAEQEDFFREHRCCVHV